MIYPWQQTIWNQLTLAAQQNRVPQALLISGPEGLGQVALAKRFAEFFDGAVVSDDAAA